MPFGKLLNISFFLSIKLVTNIVTLIFFLQKFVVKQEIDLKYLYFAC